MERNSIHIIIWIHVEISIDVAHFFMCAHDDCVWFWKFRSIHSNGCKDFVVFCCVPHGFCFWDSCRFLWLRAHVTFQSIFSIVSSMWHISSAQCVWMDHSILMCFYNEIHSVLCKSRQMARHRSFRDWMTLASIQNEARFYRFIHCLWPQYSTAIVNKWQHFRWLSNFDLKDFRELYSNIGDGRETRFEYNEFQLSTLNPSMTLSYCSILETNIFRNSFPLDWIRT